MKMFLLSAQTSMLLLLGWVAPFGQTAQKAAYRINCGGPEYIDPQGNVWSADDHYEGGGLWSTTSDIAATDMDPLYQTERWNDPGQGNLKYTFEAPGPECLRLNVG